MINLLQDRDPRKFSTEPKAQESTVEVQVQRTEGTDGWKFSLRSRRSVHINQSSSQSKLFCLYLLFSVQTLDRLNGAHQTGQGNLPLSHQLKC